MEKKWIIKTQAPEEFRLRFPEIQPLVLQLLYDRDLKTQEQVDEFMNADYALDIHHPFLFSQMEKCVAHIFDAIRKHEKITVYGDYDADGVSGTVILVSTLKKLGAEVDAYLPHREKEGYGLNVKALEYLRDKGTRHIITVDCAISNEKEIALAKEMGMTVMVTDHHHPPEVLPDCLTLHPQVSGEKYPFKKLAGAGVAFKLAQGLLLRSCEADETEVAACRAFEKWLLDLAAIGTVADLVPLVGENRTLVKYGLIVLHKTRRLGLRYLLNNAGVKLHPEKDTVSTYHIAFAVAPRINAAGRMDHASLAYELLMSEDPNTAYDLAQKIEENNQKRKATTDQMFEEVLLEMKSYDADAPAILLYKKHWNIGLAGLVAGKVAERFYRPTYILGNLNEFIAGSGRGIKGYDCIMAITHQKDMLAKFGGHKAACGFSLASDASFEKFHERMLAEAKRQLSGKDLIPEIGIDFELPFSDISWTTYDEVKKFEPFGEANPPIKFVSYGLSLDTVRAVGKDQKHLQMTLTDGKAKRKCIGFQLGHWVGMLAAGDTVDIVYEIDVNEWNGNRELQLKIIDMRKVSGTSSK